MTTNLAKIFTQIPIIAIAPAKIPTLTITGIALDSRQVQPGYLFVALTGGSADGHRYIPAAVAQGGGLGHAVNHDQRRATTKGLARIGELLPAR